MAQHPEKLRWRDAHPYGLSASQFGMALGFCGRVSDYVHYLRNIVGTEHEFKGNTFTEHGIRTEPKSRALYELLTGCRVDDGGFFVTADRILGCSPDGQVRYDATEPPIEERGALASPASETAATLSAPSSRLGSGGSSACSVRIPFKSQHRARSSTAGGAGSGGLSALCSHSSAVAMQSGDSLSRRSGVGGGVASHSRVRLLEIKSPFRALYDCTKSGATSFGIPSHYMCQIQGQLAIADCEECDFFVYLDHPVCQVEAWRVRRSRAFWSWAEPHLRCVSGWVKEGPPDWLNRAFAFGNFDFNTIDVVPLVFPFDVSANAALADARRFAYFARFPNPFEELERRRIAARAVSAVGVDVLAQDWCTAYAGDPWAALSEYQRIAVTAQTPAVLHLFAAAEAGAMGDAALTGASSTSTAGDAAVELWTRLSSWRRALEEEGVFEASATAALWRAWMRTAAAGHDPPVPVRLRVPDDWELGRVVVECRLPRLPGAACQTTAPLPLLDTAAIRLHRRLFFASVGVVGGDAGVGDGTNSACTVEHGSRAISREWSWGTVPSLPTPPARTTAPRAWC
ncbi:YqaJ-like viral recombinase domain containing protein [Novymonas esmeraldas]|uniref:YqaJ-like viral recombinase domain containing protein n=1 Tax=Novymonas esmeraldas TaxID=1808958 RepID=A0AAW0F2B6_9TRYP